MQFNNLRRGLVLAFAQTEVQDGKPCGYIMVQLRATEWVTAWYREGDSEWSHGDYCSSLKEAQESFIKRIKEKWGIWPNYPIPANKAS